MKSDRPSRYFYALAGLFGLAVKMHSAAAQSQDGRWRGTTSGTLGRS